MMSAISELAKSRSFWGEIVVVFLLFLVFLFFLCLWEKGASHHRFFCRGGDRPQLPDGFSASVGGLVTVGEGWKRKESGWNSCSTSIWI